MSNKKSIMRALVLCGLAMLMSISMLAGTTFAWFTDSVESGNNKIVAGNLDIEVDYLANGAWTTVKEASDIFDPAARWEPGHVEVAYFRVTNAGDLALKYSLLMNVVKYGDGINVYGNEFKLADYINIAIVEGVNGLTDAYGTRDEAVDAAIADTLAENRTEPRTLGNHTAERVTNDKLLSGEKEFFAVVIWMPEEVDNVANYKKGTPAPVVEFGVHVMATQTPYEEDGWNDQYDAGLSLDSNATDNATFAPEDVAHTLVATTGAGYNLATATIDKDLLTDGNDKVTLKVEKSNYDANITVAAGSETVCYDFKVEGIKADNTTIEIPAGLKIATGLDPATVEVYHYDEEIPCTYTPETGWVSFKTFTFSPFTIVFDADSTYTPEENEVLPRAEVTEYVVTDPIEWGTFGGWCPTEGIEANLDATYQFKCTQTLEEAEANKFAKWHCDFYVVLDKDLGENEIFLGGNYGSFGWVGFHNGDMTLKANTEIGLLESVTVNPWTYAQVVQIVDTFVCGVGNVGNSLEGATFTVMLRLTNPENPADYINVSTINYTWVDSTASN